MNLPKTRNAECGARNSETKTRTANLGTRNLLWIALAMLTLLAAPARAATSAHIHLWDYTDTIRRGIDKVNSNAVAAAWLTFATNWLSTNAVQPGDKIIIFPQPGSTNGIRLVTASNLLDSLIAFTNWTGGGSAAISTNGTQFGAAIPLTIKSGSVQTNNDFYGTIDFFGDVFANGSARFGSDDFGGEKVLVTGVGPNAYLEESAITANELNTLAGISGNIATSLAAKLSTSTFLTSSNDLYSLIVAAGISANTATNISRYFATNSAMITSNNLYAVLAQKTNGTLYGTVTIDGATASEVAAFSAGKALVPVPGISPTELGFIDGLTENVQDVLNTLGSTRVATNLPNRWLFWGDPAVTNKYFAENRALGIALGSNDFSGLLQGVLNRGQNGFNYQFEPIPWYTNAYVFSNTVTVTNWGTFVAVNAANPSVVFRAAPNFSGALFNLGTPTMRIGGIAHFENLRMELDQGATNATGIQLVNVVEPVIRNCEFTGYKLAGLNVNSTNSIFWSEVSGTWFVNKFSANHGIVFSATPIDGFTDINHLNIWNCTFGLEAGHAVTVSNYWPGITFQNNKLFSVGNEVHGFGAYAGGRFHITDNNFQSFDVGYPVVFYDRGSATNYFATVSDNQSDTAGPLLLLGENVQGVQAVGNRARSGDAVFRSLNNSSTPSFDESGLVFNDGTTQTTAAVLPLSAGGGLRIGTNASPSVFTNLQFVTPANTVVSNAGNGTAAIHINASSSGSTNPVVLAAGTLVSSNIWVSGLTNLGTNASVTWDTTGHRVAQMGMYGNTTLNITNLAAFTNSFGSNWHGRLEMFINHVAGDLTIASLHQITIVGTNALASGRTNKLILEKVGTRWLAYFDHAPTTGNGATYVLNDSPTIGTPTLNGQTLLGTDASIRFDEHASAPGTPASGNVTLYAKADGLLYSKDDAGTETLVSGGAGGSTSYDFPDHKTAWVMINQASATPQSLGEGASVTAAGTVRAPTETNGVGITLATGSSLNNSNGIAGANTSWPVGFDLNLAGIYEIYGVTNASRHWVGFTSASLSSMTATDWPTTRHTALLRFTETNSNWWFVTCNGSACEEKDTGVAATEYGRFKFTIDEQATAGSATNWIVSINGIAKATNSTTIPRSNMRWLYSLTTLESAPKTNVFEFVRIRANVP